MKTKIKVEEKKIEKLPEIEVTAPSTMEQKLKITSFSGDFGRQDINLLRDKLNEVIEHINNH